MASYKNSDFFKLYRLFFVVNSAACTLFLVLCFFLHDTFAGMGHTLRICNTDQKFITSLVSFWLWDIIPMCVVFLLGITIYIPVVSVACSAFMGIILALDIYTYFNRFGIFFALTMTFIRFCCAWLSVWYLSYISTSAVRLYTRNCSLIKNLDFVFIIKYIVWFAVFLLASLVLDISQCIMYRI